MTTSHDVRAPASTGLSAADRLEVAELPARFCHHSDYGEYERFADLFTDDVVTVLVGIGSYVGLDAQVRHARDTATWTSGHVWHVVSNLWIEATPEGAAVHYYLLGMLRTGSEESGKVTTSGRMVDHVARTPKGWRIRRRELTLDRPATPPDLT